MTPGGRPLIALLYGEGMSNGSIPASHRAPMPQARRERGRERGREGGREGGKEGGRERGREGGKKLWTDTVIRT